MRPTCRAAIAIAALLLACTARRAAPPSPAAAAPVAASGEAPPALRLPPDVRPLRYALELEVDPDAEGFRGEVAIDVALERATSSIWLHARGLRVSRASAGGAAGSVAATLREVNADGLARLDLAASIGPGRTTLRLAWEGAWGQGRGLFRARSAGASYAASQLESIAARTVFPGFDEPAFKTPFDVALVVPERAVAVSNGPEIGSVPVPGGRRRVAFATTKPLPTYLLFFGAGPWEVVTAPDVPPNEVRDRPLPLRGLAPRGRGGELALAMRAAAEMIPIQERWFGIPFPYDKLDQIAVPGFVAGGMENAGAIAYADAILLVPAQGAGFQQERTVAGVIAHELAHMWFGDYVTLPWWTDIWLNESFATWMGTSTLERWRPEWRGWERVARGPYPGGDPPANRASSAGVEWAMQQDVLPGARAIRKPLERMADVGSQFDAATYSKGAALLRMFERWIGPDAFRAGVREYLAAHAHGTGATQDLLAALSRAGGRDVAGPLRSFLDRSGVPLVEARAECGAGGAAVRLRRSAAAPRGAPPPPATWSVPVCVRYAAGGAERERCTLLDADDASVPVPEGCPDWIFPDAGGAGYYRFLLAPADRARLLEAGLARLDGLEKIALAGSLRAAQRAGTLPYGEAMEPLVRLARDADPFAATLSIPALAHARSSLVPEAARPSVEAVARALYAPAAASLGWDPRPGEGPDEREERAALARVLVRTARDPDARRELGRRGLAFLGARDGRLHPEALDPDLVEDAVAAAVGEGGAPVFDLAVERALATSDAAARARILPGAAAAARPELVRRGFALSRDPRLAPAERIQTVEGWFRDPATQAEALLALEREAEGLVAAFPQGTRAALPTATAWLCDRAAAERVRAALEPLLGRAPELRVPLGAALERIRACAAERDGDGAAAAEWFEERAGPHGRAAR